MRELRSSPIFPARIVWMIWVAALVVWLAMALWIS